MSVQTGKKNYAAYKAFQEANKDGGALVRMAKALERRTLGEKHFQQAAAFFKDLQNTSPLNIFSTLRDKPSTLGRQRQISLLNLSMTMPYMPDKDDKQKDTEADFDSFVPLTYHGIVTPNLVIECQRALPLHISSQHTEYRFIQRTADTLDYQSEEFRHAMAVGLALTRVIGATQTSLYAPISIPHARGFMLGYTVACQDEHFWPASQMLAMNAGNQYVAIGLPGSGQGFEPEWSPRVYCDLRTFISHAEMNAAQRALHQKLMTFFENSITPQVLSELVTEYSTGANVNGESLEPLFKRLLDDPIASLVTSPEWHAANAKGEKHLPKNDMH